MVAYIAMVGQVNGLFSPQVSLNHLLMCKPQQVEQMRDRHTITSSSPTAAAPYQGCRDSDFVFLHISSAWTYVTQVSGALQSFLHLLSNPQFLHLFTFTFPPSVWTEWPPGNFQWATVKQKRWKTRSGRDFGEENEIFKDSMGLGPLSAGQAAHGNLNL